MGLILGTGFYLKTAGWKFDSDKKVFHINARSITVPLKNILHRIERIRKVTNILGKILVFVYLFVLSIISVPNCGDDGVVVARFKEMLRKLLLFNNLLISVSRITNLDFS